MGKNKKERYSLRRLDGGRSGHDHETHILGTVIRNMKFGTISHKCIKTCDPAVNLTKPRNLKKKSLCELKSKGKRKKRKRKRGHKADKKSREIYHTSRSDN